MECIVVIHRLTQAAHRDQRVIVGIFEPRAGRRFQHLAAGLVDHTPATEIDPVGARTTLAAIQPACHLQQVTDRDRPAWIGAIVPVGNHSWIIDINQAIAARGTQNGRGNRLAGRPCPLRRLMIYATHDQHGAGACAGAIGPLVKGERHRRFKALGLFGTQLDFHVGTNCAAPVLRSRGWPAGKMRQEGNQAGIGADGQLRTAKAGAPGGKAWRHGR